MAREAGEFLFFFLPGHCGAAFRIAGYGQRVGDVVPHQLAPYGGQRSQVLVRYALLNMRICGSNFGGPIGNTDLLADLCQELI
jgi:hypothetical protein